MLYIANKNTLHLMSCKHTVEAKKVERRESHQINKQSIKLESNIWALFTKPTSQRKKNSKPDI